MRRAMLLAALAAATPALALGGTSAERLSATLTGGNEVPAVDTPARGRARLTISRVDGRTRIRWRLEGRGLSGTPQAAHIHLGARGQAGPVIFPMKVRPFSLPASGTLDRGDFQPAPGARTFSAALRAIRAGRTYTNVHTQRYPAGEIRGQNRRRR